MMVLNPVHNGVTRLSFVLSPTPPVEIGISIIVSGPRRDQVWSATSCVNKIRDLNVYFCVESRLTKSGMIEVEIIYNYSTHSLFIRRRLQTYP